MHYVIRQDTKVIIIVTISKVQSNQKVTQPQYPLTPIFLWGKYEYLERAMRDTRSVTSNRGSDKWRASGFLSAMSTGLVTSYVETAFYNKLLKER